MYAVTEFINRLRRFFLFAVVCSFSFGCKSEGKGSFITLEISAKPGIIDPAFLNVQLSFVDYSNQIFEKKFPLILDNKPLTLPTSVAVRTDGWKGLVEITVSAISNDNQVLGEGQEKITLIESEIVP